MIQGSIKFKNYSLEWLFQPSKLAKFDSLWIRVCAIVAFTGYREAILLTFPQFSLLLQNFIDSFSPPKNLCLFFVTYPSFYSEILASQGTHWFPCFVLWLTEPVPCPSLDRFYFLFFHSFPLFSFDSFECPWLVTYFRMCWGMPFLISPFGNSPFLPFFPSRRNPILPIWKSPVAIPLFVLLHSGSPRRFPLAPWEVTSYFLFFC